MPCSCDGFEYERTHFGKKYRGVTGGFTGSGSIIPEQFDWEEVVHDGEKALCRAQSVVKDLLYAIDDAFEKGTLLTLDAKLYQRAHKEIQALVAHKKAEARKKRKK